MHRTEASPGRRQTALEAQSPCLSQCGSGGPGCELPGARGAAEPCQSRLDLVPAPSGTSRRGEDEGGTVHSKPVLQGVGVGVSPGPGPQSPCPLPRLTWKYVAPPPALPEVFYQQVRLLPPGWLPLSWGITGLAVQVPLPSSWEDQGQEHWAW